MKVFFGLFFLITCNFQVQAQKGINDAYKISMHKVSLVGGFRLNMYYKGIVLRKKEKDIFTLAIDQSLLRVQQRFTDSEMETLLKKKLKEEGKDISEVLPKLVVVKDGEGILSRINKKAVKYQRNDGKWSLEKDATKGNKLLGPIQPIFSILGLSPEDTIQESKEKNQDITLRGCKLLRSKPVCIKTEKNLRLQVEILSKHNNTVQCYCFKIVDKRNGVVLLARCVIQNDAESYKFEAELNGKQFKGDNHAFKYLLGVMDSILKKNVEVNEVEKLEGVSFKKHPSKVPALSKEKKDKN